MSTLNFIAKSIGSAISTLSRRPSAVNLASTSAAVVEPPPPAGATTADVEPAWLDHREYDPEGNNKMDIEQPLPKNSVYYDGFSDEEVRIPGAPLDYSPGEDYYVPSGKWEFMRYDEIHDIKLSEMIGGESCRRRRHFLVW
jgi:hypothetical protein